MTLIPTNDDDVPFAPDLPTVNQPPKLHFSPIRAFAAVEEEGADPLVVVAHSTAKLRAAIPHGGLILVYGDGGAGKTTLLVDVAMHLAAGDTWCDLLQPVRPLRVGWIENEGPRPMMRAKLSAKLEGWQGSPDQDRLLVLDEPWALFSFKTADLREQLTTLLNDLQIEILVAGPLGRLGMEGGGTSDDIRVFLELVEEVLAGCTRRPTLVLVHHENRAGQISGAWEREPDTLIHVQGQGHGRTRIHWAKVRWSSDLHGTSTQLIWADGETFTVEARPPVTEETMTDEILEAVRDHPGESWTTIRKHVRGNASEAAAIRDRLLKLGELLNTAQREGQFRLWRDEDSAETRSEPGTALERVPDTDRSEAGTGWERLPFPSPDGAPETTRSPVPYVSRNGVGNGTALEGPGPQIGQHDTTEPDASDQAMIDAIEIERLEALARTYADTGDDT